MRITIETDGDERVATPTTSAATDRAPSVALNGGVAPGGTSMELAAESGPSAALPSRLTDNDGGSPSDELRLAIEQAGPRSMSTPFGIHGGSAKM